VFHSVGTQIIDLIDATNASGAAYVTLLRFDGLAEWGRYRDRYVFRDDRWSFASREVFVEGRAFGPSLGSPPTSGA
jgi:hypothetical protein